MTNDISWMVEKNREVSPAEISSPQEVLESDEKASITCLMIFHGCRAAEPDSHPHLPQAMDFLAVLLSVKRQPQGLDAVYLNLQL